MKSNFQKSGLLPTPTDPRDYSYAKNFGVGFRVDLPEEYVVRLPIKNQAHTDFCTAFAACTVSEAQEGIQLSPEWLFSRYGKPGVYGADLRQAMKAGVKWGFLSKDRSPFDVHNQERDFLADKANWPSNLDLFAEFSRKKGYFQADLPFNKFESIKQTLWQNKNKKCLILTGSKWYNEWSYAPNGIVPLVYEDFVTLHAFAIIGWKGDYIVVQNSYGEDVGDKGLFYFPKEVVEKEFIEPMYMYIDLDEIPAPVGSPLQILFFKIKKFLQI